jgi:hypothetical protein
MIAVCGACRDDTAPKYVAVGTLVHDGLAEGDQTAWAKEMEVVKRLGPHEGRGVAVTRRGDSRLIDVSVTGDDPERTLEACNQVLGQYARYRMELRDAAGSAERDALKTRIERLRAELAKAPSEPPAVAAAYEQAVSRLRELEVAAGATRNDVHWLDACKVTKRGGER